MMAPSMVTVLLQICHRYDIIHIHHPDPMAALALYVSSELLAILLKNIEVSEMVYNGIHAVIAPLKWASFAYAVYFVLLNFAIGYVLYRKKIYIKL